MPRCSVLVVTYNSAALIGPCLKALASQTWTDWEAVVVDNTSTDETCERIETDGKRIRLIRNADNRGFPAAINQALHHAQGEWILTLNPDVLLRPPCLARLLEAATSAEARVGMLSPKLLRADGRTIDSTGLIVNRAWRVWDRGSQQRDQGQFDRPCEILGPCAAAGLYRRAMLNALQEEGRVFDERLFLLMEDVDLAWRAQQAGWRGCYVPEAVASHRGGFSRHRSLRAQALAFRNRYHLIAKHHQWAWQDLSWVLGYDVPRLGWLLATNPYTLPMLWDLCAARLPKRA